MTFSYPFSFSSFLLLILSALLSFQQSRVVCLLPLEFTASALYGRHKLAVRTGTLDLRLRQYAGQLSKLLLEPSDLPGDLADMVLPACNLAGHELLRLCVKSVLFLLKSGY